MPVSLDYQRPDAASPRTSKLALASLLLSISGFPCLTVRIFEALRDKLQLRWDVTPAVIFVPVITSVVAVIAIVRIRSSKRALTGTEAGYFGLALSLFWLVAEFSLWLMFRGARSVPATDL
jgi:hypothetical protein